MIPWLGEIYTGDNHDNDDEDDGQSMDCIGHLCEMNQNAHTTVYL